jgi:DNA polymerase I-like protein with 3'-5' exonuclease and polymerase domains
MPSQKPNQEQVREGLAIALRIIETFEAVAKTDPGGDIYVKVAAKVWEVPESEVTRDQRMAVKRTTFANRYAMSPEKIWEAVDNIV